MVEFAHLIAGTVGGMVATVSIAAIDSTYVTRLVGDDEGFPVAIVVGALIPN